MKKYIFLTLLLLIPVMSFASSDNITIDPITITSCGAQQVTITGTADYMTFLRKVVVRLDFAFDENYRESILRPWRAIIFGNK